MQCKQFYVFTVKSVDAKKKKKKTTKPNKYYFNKLQLMFGIAIFFEYFVYEIHNISAMNEKKAVCMSLYLSVCTTVHNITYRDP